MGLRLLKHWGMWPARLASAGLVLFGAYSFIASWIDLARGDDNPASYIALFRMFGAFLLIALGALAGLCVRLTRRRSRNAVIAGMIGLFFLAGLIAVDALTIPMVGLPLAAALGVAASFALAGGTALAGWTSE
jgi:hypothetical protein